MMVILVQILRAVDIHQISVSDEVVTNENLAQTMASVTIPHFCDFVVLMLVCLVLMIVSVINHLVVPRPK